MKDQILEKLLFYLQNTGDFILEQAPDVVQQALRYEKISAYFSSAVLFALLTIALCVGIYNLKNPKLTKYDDWQFQTLISVVIPAMALAPLLFGLYAEIDKIIKLTIAPKYYLIQLFMNLKG